MPRMNHRRTNEEELQQRKTNGGLKRVLLAQNLMSNNRVFIILLRGFSCI